MSSVLPLEVLGLMGPILCWVEGIRRPGLPESWSTTNLPFEKRIRRWLMRDLPNYSVDNLDEIIRLSVDRRSPYDFLKEPRVPGGNVYPMAPPQGFDLVYMFKKLSDRYFKWTGNELCIREGRLVELHELAMRFPIRHLILYCHADAVLRGYISMERAFELPAQMSHLHTTYRSLRNVVDKGLSEGHLHLNGVINADESWTYHLFRPLAPGPIDGSTPDVNRLLVLSRTAVRLLVMGVIYSFMDEDRVKLPFHLIAFLDNIYRARDRIENRFASQDLNDEYLKELKLLQDELSKRAVGEWNNELEWLMPLVNSDIQYIFSQRGHSKNRERTFEARGIRACMRLLKRLYLHVHRILVERYVRFDNVSPGLEPYESERTSREKRFSLVREFIHQLSCRYLIYHAHHWQKVTQSGKTTGLRYFQRFFSAPQREPLVKDSTDVHGLAIEQLSQTGPLRAVEGRLSPPSTGISKFIPWVTAFANQVESDQLDKFGIVVHFIKESHETLDSKNLSKCRMNLRYGKIRRLTQANAFRLFRLLSNPNVVAPFIVGIDAASLELSTPPEVFAPAFRFLREYPVKLRSRSTTKEAFSHYKDIAALVENRRLGMTYHVGEDFRHLLSGLRAIHEVIEFLKPLPGDRLGHAIALALEPEIWAAQVGFQAVMPRQEWLDTLVWLHYLLGPGHDLIGQLAVEDQIQLNSRRIYGKSKLKKCGGEDGWEWTPTTLYDSWRLRQLDPYSLVYRGPDGDKHNIRQRGQGTEHKRWADVQRSVLNEVDQHVGTDDAYRLVKLYWDSPGIRRVGNEIITIDMQEKKDLWLKVSQEAQQKMQELVRSRQLVIEVNPSSNRIIGPMEKMADHPIFRLTLDKQQRLERQVRVTINTDDPGIFATSLSHEFYLLGEILLGRNVPETELVEWLDWLRENGKDYSFLQVLPGAKNEHMASIIDCLLKKYAPLLRRLRGERRKYESPEERFKSKYKKRKSRN